jgi:large conductance mechanosensitive channel
MWEDFKAFAIQGNALDLAVGVIIGGAFGSIVTSLVEDLLMPILGILLGGVDFTELVATVGGATVRYGVFLQRIVDFLIIAFSIFIFIRMLSRLKKKEPEADAVEETPAPTQEELLAEIRDLIKEQATRPYSE